MYWLGIKSLGKGVGDMRAEYVKSKYEKTREDSWEFQKYWLESEIEKKRFTYENALYEQKIAQKRMRDFWQNVQISLLWAFGTVLFPFLATKLEQFSILTGIVAWTVIPFAVIWALLCLLYTLKKIKFGFSYKEIKSILEQEDILVGKSALELHKQELELEKYPDSLTEGALKGKQKEEWEEAEEEREYRQRQMRLQVFRMQLERARRGQKQLKNQMENMMEEEQILVEKERRYRRFLIGSILGEGIGLALLGMPGNFIEVACSSWCMLLPPFVMFPTLCLWLRAKMELSVGEELWLNRVFFSFLHKNSFYKRQENIREQIVQQQQKIEELEQQITRLTCDEGKIQLF